MTPAAGVTASPWANSGSAKGTVALSPSCAAAAGTGQQAQGLHHPSSSSSSSFTMSSSSQRVPRDFWLQEWDKVTGLGNGEAAVGSQRCSATLLSDKNTFPSTYL